MINKKDQVSTLKIDLEILCQEKILPVLPLMNRWSSEAFQKPPYSYAGVATTELVDPQDLLYVNDPNGIVIIAKNMGKVVGVAAGLPFDSKDLQSYFESRLKESYKGAYREMNEKGFNPSKMFYLTYILTSQEFGEKSLLSHSIFNAIKNWAMKSKKKQICWQEHVSSLHTSEIKKVETWQEDVGGFIKMGIQFTYPWPTRQFDGTIKEADHTMEFFYKEI